jgi:hypothetical protein
MKIFHTSFAQALALNPVNSSAYPSSLTQAY